MAKNAKETHAGNEKSFEESMAELEALLEKLESPDTPLETVIKSFAEGQRLLKICQKRLKDAELVLEKATENGQTEKL